MSDKEYTMISGFILPKEEMKVESIAKVEGEIKKTTFKDKTGKEKTMLYVSTDEGHINLMGSANYIKSIVNGEER